MLAAIFIFNNIYLPQACRKILGKDGISNRFVEIIFFINEVLFLGLRKMVHICSNNSSICFSAVKLMNNLRSFAGEAVSR